MASQVAANIDIQLRGSTGGLDKSLVNADKKLGSFRGKVDAHGKAIEGRFGGMMGRIGRGVSGIASSMGTLLAGAGKGIAGIAAAAAAALGAMVMKQIGVIDRMLEVAEKIGITTEALSALQYHADLAGVSAESLEVSLQKMIRGIADAGRGTGEAADALRRLGLDARELAGLAPEEQLARIADAMQGVRTQGEKVSIAMSVFGRGGADMLNVVSGGAERLRAGMEEAASLGLTFSREQGMQAELVADAWTRLKMSVVGLARQLAINLGPTIQHIADGIRSFFASVREGASNAAPYLEGLWNVVKTGWDFIVGFSAKVLEALVSPFRLFGNFLTNTFGITWESFKRSFLAGLATVEYAFIHWEDVMLLGSTHIALAMVELYETVKHVLLTGLPEVFGAVGNFFATFFTNLWTNITANIGAIWEYITTLGDSGGEFSWEPLTEGFDEAVARIAAAAARVPSDLERELSREVATIEARMAGGLAAHIADRLRGLGLPGGEVIAPGPPRPDGTDDEGGGRAGLGAVERGSAEAFKIIAGAQGDKMYSVAMRQLRENERMRELLDRIWRNTREGIAAAAL